jgi:insulysin
MLKSFLVLVLTSSFLLAEEKSYTMIEDSSSYPLLNPTLEGRKTAKIRLNNGVEAYLISDPEVDQSAAAVCMEAGSWQDPEKYPGMAHFLEHMLFMGTEAYPGEDDYSKYIQDNGGTINAFTTSDRTVYMFSINNHAFVGALDRFSHFFIDPLFNPACINRELQAVDQENSKNLENDFWRAHMVFKETSKEGHPLTKFSTGNAETLSGIPQEALKKWYKTHYSADKLHLVMLSSLPLEEMIDLAIADFSAVEKVPSPKDPSLSGAMLSKEQQGHMIYIQPIKDLKILSLMWEMPKNLSSIDQKWTEELISYALSEASDHSLLKELKKEKLVERINAGSDRFGKTELFFRIDIELTDKGLSQIDTIILRCYQALARLKQSGLPLSLFQEIQKISQINYQYQTRQNPFKWASDTAYNIADEPLASFPEKTAVPSEFNPEELLQFLSKLTPESAVYVLLADPDKLAIDMTNEEKWMKVPYTVKAIPPSKIASWQQAAPYGEIGLPPSNPFIPQSLTLCSEITSEEKVLPKKLLDNSKMSCYFAPDVQYKTPEASLLFKLQTPDLNGSARSYSLAALLCKGLYEELSSTLFLAESAGLSCSISSQNMSLTIEVGGYSEKAPDLTKTIFSKLGSVSFSEEDFELHKNYFLSAYANGAFDLPVKQAMKTLSNILENDAPTPKEMLQALEVITYEEFVTFTRNWLNTIYLESMVYGNFTEAQAKNLFTDLEKTLASSAPYENRKKQEVLILPSNQGPFQVEQATEMQGNGTVLAIQAGAISFEKKAVQKILSDALHEAFFDTLRTKQQTGYIAQSWPAEIEEEMLQLFAVQSSSVSPENLLIRFELFLEDFDKRSMEIISKERFELLKSVQITSLEIPPIDLYAMAGRLNALAFDRHGEFYWIEKTVQALQNLSYEDFIEETHKILSHQNRRRLAVLVKGKAQKKPFTYQIIAKDDMLKIGTFSSTQ